MASHNQSALLTSSDRDLIGETATSPDQVIAEPAEANEFAPGVAAPSTYVDLLNPLSLSLESLLAIGLVVGVLIAIVAHRVALSQREGTRWLFTIGCVVAAVASVAMFADWSGSQDAQRSVFPSPPFASQRGSDWWVSQPVDAASGIASSEPNRDAKKPLGFEARVSNELEVLEGFHAQLEQHIASLSNATNERVHALEQRIADLRRDAGVGDDCREIQQELAQLRQTRSAIQQSSASLSWPANAWPGRAPLVRIDDSGYGEFANPPSTYTTAYAGAGGMPRTDCSTCKARQQPMSVVQSAEIAHLPPIPVAVTSGYLNPYSVPYVPSLQTPAAACPALFPCPISPPVCR